MKTKSECAAKSCTDPATTTWKGKAACARCRARAYMGGDFDLAWARRRAIVKKRVAKVKTLRAQGLHHTEIAKKLGCSSRSVYRALALLK